MDSSDSEDVAARTSGLVIGSLAAGAAALVAAGRLRRYAIAEWSMTPALRPGDFVVAVATSSPPRRGEIIVVEHPDRPDFELVKRVAAVAGDQPHPHSDRHLAMNEVFLLGDNPAVSAADSRTLGPIRLDGSHWRVVARYWPQPRLFRAAASGTGIRSRAGDDGP